MLSISVSDKEYTGKEILLIEKEIIVMDGDYQLRPGIDYILYPESYRNNVKRGRRNWKAEERTCGNKVEKSKYWKSPGDVG